MMGLNYRIHDGVMHNGIYTHLPDGKEGSVHTFLHVPVAILWMTNFCSVLETKTQS